MSKELLQIVRKYIIRLTRCLCKVLEFLGWKFAWMKLWYNCVTIFKVNLHWTWSSAEWSLHCPTTCLHQGFFLEWAFGPEFTILSLIRPITIGYTLSSLAHHFVWIVDLNYNLEYPTKLHIYHNKKPSMQGVHWLLHGTSH